MVEPLAVGTADSGLGTGVRLANVHPLDQPVAQCVDVLDELVGEERAVEVAHDLVDPDDDAPALVVGERLRLDVGVDELPLARPVRADGVVADLASALHPVGPVDVRLQERQRAVDVAER